jgi:hypothetical protein
MKLSFFFSVLLIGLFLISCGDDNSVICGTTFSLSTEIQAELDAFTNAAILYVGNPTSDNCNAYRNAAQDYLDAIESYRDCADDAGQLAEFNQSLLEAQESVDGIIC